MTTKCKVDLCRNYHSAEENDCTLFTDIAGCKMHRPDPRDKIIKDQAMRLIAQETDKFYDTIIASVSKSKLTLNIEATGAGAHITLTGPLGTYGFTVVELTERIDYEQAMDKFNRVRRLADG